MNDNFTLSDSSNGSVGNTLVESFALRGYYEVVCMEPVPAHADAYLKAFATVQEIEQLGRIRRALRHRSLRAARLVMAATPMRERWRDDIRNLVPTVGKNFTLDTLLSGSSYTAAWYLGLISATGYSSAPALGDTMASHSGWAEDQNYTSSTRPTMAFASASAGAKSLTTPQAFTMNATTTIKGSFVSSSSIKGGTTGTLLSAGLFTGGDQAVSSGNILNVSYQATM
jgi:hypothetical protein